MRADQDRRADESKYAIHFHGPTQGVHIGDSSDIPMQFFPSAPSPGMAYRGLRATPPLTDRRVIERRTALVEQILTKITQPDLNGLFLTGIGGVGKSTLASLIYHHVKIQQEAGCSPFREFPLWLQVDASATFADIMGTLYQALEKPLPDLKTLSLANQAYALCSLLGMAPARLIVLDQFEHLLDGGTGQALPDRPGITEFLQALNSQPLHMGCRLLLTSRFHPNTGPIHQQVYVQEYLVEGLTTEEGVGLLGLHHVQGREAYLQQAVISCHGHALSLMLLIALVQDYGMPLTDLLEDRSLWDGDIATNLLDTIFQKLSDLQRDLLRAFSVYRTPVPIEAALAVLPMVQRNLAYSALRPLLKQHLIQKTDEASYQLHIILAHYAQLHFVGRGEESNLHTLQEAHSLAAQYYVQQAGKHCPSLEERRCVNDVQPLVEAVWHYCQAGQWQEAYRVVECEYLFPSLYCWGGYGILLEILLLLVSEESWQQEQILKLYLYLGMVCDDLGRKLQALIFYKYCLQVYRRENNRSGEAAILNNMGKVYLSVKRLQEALTYYQQALVANQEVGDRPGEGVIYSGLGGIYHHLGRIDEAFQCLEQALSICRETGNLSGEATTLNSLGRIYHTQGEMQEALKFHQQALTLFQKVGHRDGEAAALNNQGLCSLSLGKREEALEYYQQALRIREETGNLSGEGAVLENLGYTYRDLGKEEEAVEYYQQALTIYQNIGHRSGEGAVFNKLGDVYAVMEKMEEALEYYQKALIIHQELKDPGEQATSLSELGRTHHALGMNQEALVYYQKALALYQEAHDHTGIGTVYNNMGGVFHSLGKEEEALKFYQKALFIHAQSKDRSGEGVSLYNIGTLYFYREQYRIALAALFLAMHIFKALNSPYQNIVQRWIDGLEVTVGGDEFLTLQVSVEPQLEQILHDALRVGLARDRSEKEDLQFDES
jgi:tetratricopeptide (TPR) repeat protein